MLYVELDNDGVTRHLHYALYLDYRPLADNEPAVDAFLERPECAWVGRDPEQAAQAYAVADVVPTSGRRASATRSRTCWPARRTRGKAGGRFRPGAPERL